MTSKRQKERESKRRKERSSRSQTEEANLSIENIKHPLLTKLSNEVSKGKPDSQELEDLIEQALEKVNRGELEIKSVSNAINEGGSRGFKERV